MHEMLIAEHGGAFGLLSEDLLDSSLANPATLLAYGTPDLFDLASKYAASLTRNHPFRDGNKRIAFTVAGVFLELNGQRLDAPEVEAVEAVLALTSGELDEAGFAAWLRMNCERIPRTKRAVERKKRIRKKK